MWHQNRIDALDSSGSPTFWRNPVNPAATPSSPVPPKRISSSFLWSNSWWTTTFVSLFREPVTVGKRRGNPGHCQILNRNCRDGKLNQKDVLFLFTASSIWDKPRTWCSWPACFVALMPKQRVEEWKRLDLLLAQHCGRFVSDTSPRGSQSVRSGKTVSLSVKHEIAAPSQFPNWTLPPCCFLQCWGET